jgi:hypothetical protein
MGNAIEAVKKEAHTVIGSHHVDSVVEFIEGDWLRSSRHSLVLQNPQNGVK